MEFNTIVKFKSVEDNYRKEVGGEKRNTVRIVTEKEDMYLQFILKDIKFIKISCINHNKREKEYMIRPITDITRFESPRLITSGLIIYIFSW